MAEETTEVVLDDAKADAAAEGGEEEKVERLEQSIDVTDAGPCAKHVKVTVPAGEVKRYFDKEVGKFVKEAAVPGFRPGKTPRKLIERKFRTEAADSVRSAILQQSLQQIDADKVLDLISEPDLKPEAIVIPEEGELVYEFNAEVRPTFDLPDVREIAVDRPSHQVSDADVEAEIEAIQARFATKENKTTPAAKGDYLLCDIRVKDGEETTADLVEQEVRVEDVVYFNDGRIDGFAKQMIGVKVDDHRTLPLNLSKEIANESAAGKTLQAEFVVTEVRETKAPELDEKFFREFGVADLGELRDWVKNILDQRLKQIQHDSMRKQIVSKLLEKTKIDLPTNLLRRQSDQELRKRVVELSQAGYTDEDIRNEVNRLRQAAVANTAFFMKERFLIEKIAETQKIEVTEEDVDAGIEELAERFSESSRRVRARLERDGLLESFERTLFEKKTIGKLLETCKVNDVALKEPLTPKTSISAVNANVAPEEAPIEVPAAT
jgi:trigger factor